MDVVTMDRTAGVREVKARLSHYLDVARQEGAVIITDRGRPVARLTAIREAAREASLDDVLDALAAEGTLERATEPTSKRRAHPVPVAGGVSGSGIVAQMRR